MPAGLESYFYLSSRSEAPPHEQISLPQQRGPVYKGMKNQVLEVASALAFICVNESYDEVYAVGIRFSGDGRPAVIHIAGNNTISSETLSYLEDVVSQLTAISQDQQASQESELSPEFDDTKKKPQVDILVAGVLKHTFRKFWRSLTRREISWNERIKEIQSELSSSKADTALFEHIENCLNLVYKLASTYKEGFDEGTSDEGALIKLSKFLQVLDKVIRRSRDKDKIAKLLRRIDLKATHAYTPESSPEPDDDVDVDENNILRPGFSMTRYIYRTIATIIHTRDLLKVALSPKFRKFFLKQPEVHYCQPVRTKVNIDPPDVLQSLHNASSSLVANRGKQSVTISLHAELVIFRTLVKNFVEGKDSYWAIGVSKLMCFGCHTMISAAFVDVLNNHSTGLAPIAVQGTHGKIYPWVAPDLSFANRVVGFDLQNELLHVAKGRIRAALSAYVEKDPPSDSSAGSEKSDSRSDLDELYAEVSAELQSLHRTS